MSEKEEEEEEEEEAEGLIRIFHSVLILRRGPSMPPEGTSPENEPTLSEYCPVQQRNEPSIPVEQDVFSTTETRGPKRRVTIPAPSQGTPTYNILLLGPSQAGKSNFLEGIKKYIDPKCEIEREALGNGYSSCTREVREKYFKTTFPEYHLFQTTFSDETEAMYSQSSTTSDTPRKREVKIDELFKENAALYKEMIDQNDLQIRQDEHSAHEQTIIRILDTPGLDDTEGKDERNMARILELVDAVAIHLVVILISSQAAGTPGFRNTVKTYSDIFSAMNSLMVFVHTRAEYKKLHFDDKQFMGLMKARTMDLNTIMGRDIQHFAIDVDLNDDKPVTTFLTYRTIRHILLLARLNNPVPLKNMQIKKTPKMRAVDNIVARAYEARLVSIQSKGSSTQSEVSREEELVCEIQKARYEIRELEEYLKNHDTEDLELVYEARYGQDWEVFSIREDKFLQYSSQDFNIDKVDVHNSRGVKIETKGGQGYPYWKAVLSRKFCKEGEYHVKIYVKRNNRHKAEIHNRKEKLTSWKEKLEARQKDLEGLRILDNGTLTGRGALKAEYSRCYDLLKRAARSTLHLRQFRAIADAGVYEGEHCDCIKKLEDFYATYVPLAEEEVLVEQDDMEQVPREQRGPQLAPAL
ncbi:hypothetical protein BGX28_000778 [Mortierella sp. GBA30]|nr:hypothetical protein BGX28_000778 [Mortierella sp. GBA30]